MKLRDFLLPLLKWWWLILIATVIAGVSAFFVTRPQPPIYQARATLLVGSAFRAPNPNTNDIGLSQDLASTYADLANRDIIRNAVMKDLGLPALPQYTATNLPSSELIEIAVIDINPQRAQAVANDIAKQLVLQSPVNQQVQDQGRVDFINQQLDAMQADIKKATNDLNAKQQQLQTLTSAVQISEAQAEIDALQTKLSILQTNYVTLLDNSQKGAVNSVSIIEPASLPTHPIGPNKPLIMLLVALAGFILAAGTANLLEYLDRTLKTPEDIRRVMDLPVIGLIGEMNNKDKFTLVSSAPRSPIAEAFRTLRTNIQFSSVDKPLKTIMVTSPGTSDGKTTLSTNLAQVMAQGEKRVVLVDADMRRPSIHEALKIPIQPGLSDVFRERTSVFDVVRNWKDKAIALVTAGNPPPNPSELLGSKKMDQVLAELEGVMDMVILDSPPSLVTDASVLASKVDGVILVIRPGETREEVARAMLEQLHRTNANIIGVVLNRVPRRSEFYGYQSYSSYYNDSAYFDNNSNGKTAKPKREPAQ